MRSATFRILAGLGLALLPLFGLACPEPIAPNGTEEHHKCTEKERKFARNALSHYKKEEIEDAGDDIAHTVQCTDGDVRIVAAKIALAGMNWKSAIDTLKDVDGSEAAALRARGYWYSDDLQDTAAELATVLDDPDYDDRWAKPIRELAGMQGAGRHPFELVDGSAPLLDIRMPRDLYPAIMLPVEIDGQSTIALVVTSQTEVVLDSKARTQAGWVTMRFGSGDRWMEFRDVPAMVQDLTQYTGNQTVPVGAIIGVNFLRRMHVTIDRRADQFILRASEPPPPPAYTRVPITYVRGGGMVVRATLRREFEQSGGLWVDTGSAYNLALPDATWKTLGVDPKTLSTFQTLQHGRITDVRLGGLDVGAVEAIAGVTQLEGQLGALDVDVLGGMGVGFWTAMRVTVAEGGRALWLETDEDTSLVLAPSMPTESSNNTPRPPTPATSGSVKPSTSTSTSAAPATSAKPPAPKPSTSSSAKPPPPPATSGSVKAATTKS